MKRYLFLWLVVFLIILMLIYFYDRREAVISKIYSDNNIYIRYPYFNNRKIDSYINSYLNSIINNSDYRYNYYIDYNYDNDLSIYTYKYYDNVYSYNIDSFDVCIPCNSISRYLK